MKLFLGCEIIVWAVGFVFSSFSMVPCGGLRGILVLPAAFERLDFTFYVFQLLPMAILPGFFQLQAVDFSFSYFPTVPHAKICNFSP